MRLGLGVYGMPADSNAETAETVGASPSGAGHGSPLPPRSSRLRHRAGARMPELNVSVCSPRLSPRLRASASRLSLHPPLPPHLSLPFSSSPPPPAPPN